MTQDAPLPDVPRWRETALPGEVGGAPVDGAVVDAPTPLVAAERLAALHRQAEQVVPPLARAIGWLRWPSLLLLVLAAVAPVPLLVLALTWQGWPRVVGVLLALAAAVPVVLFGISRAGTLRAAAAPGALVAELTAFTSHVNGGLGVMDRLGAVAQRGGGVRLLGRIRAVWGVVQLPVEALEHLDAQTHLRWIVPPRVGETWGRLLLMIWTAVITLVVGAGLGAASLTRLL